MSVFFLKQKKSGFSFDYENMTAFFFTTEIMPEKKN
jgi:hypothetical protein